MNLRVHPQTQGIKGSNIKLTQKLLKMLKLKNYWSPTPKLYRALGDALLSIGATASAYGIATDDKFIAMFCLFAGVIGKFLTNFFAADSPEGADNS